MAGKDLTLAIATATVEAVGGAYGVVGAGSVINALMQDLLQLQDEQSQSVARIEAGVQQLITAPWRTAQNYLKECGLPGRSAKQVKASLRKAAEKLKDALGAQRSGSFAAAYAAYDLAVVLALLGDKTASNHYAKMSAATATDAAIDFARAGMVPSSAFRGDLELVRNEIRALFRLPPIPFSELVKSKEYLQVLDDWRSLVNGASRLCGVDLTSLHYPRLRPYVART